MAGTPTPTQDELNKIALDEPVTLASDGSGPDPNVFTLDHKAAAKAPATSAPPHVARTATAGRTS